MEETKTFVNGAIFGCTLTTVMATLSAGGRGEGQRDRMCPGHTTQNVSREGVGGRGDKIYTVETMCRYLEVAAKLWCANDQEGRWCGLCIAKRPRTINRKYMSP